MISANTTCSAIRANIGVIFQDFVRYHFTAADNIAVGRIEARDDRVRIVAAAERSLADEVIQRLPQGYDQILGKRFRTGIDLSGGEWQKIAIARAYMRDAQLLILDEPTAALDARSEFEVFKRFKELSKGKTAVLISHRFSSVRMADRIVVLLDGAVEAMGTHAELLERAGAMLNCSNCRPRATDSCGEGQRDPGGRAGELEPAHRASLGTPLADGPLRGRSPGRELPLLAPLVTKRRRGALTDGKATRGASKINRESQRRRRNEVLILALLVAFSVSAMAGKPTRSKSRRSAPWRAMPSSNVAAVIRRRGRTWTCARVSTKGRRPV